MAPRVQTAGTAGIIAGIALAVGFVLFATSGLTPDILTDPAKGLAYVGSNGGRLRLMMAFFLLGTGFATVFLAGLAGKLHERTPTRASATLYLGIVGIAGHGLGALIFWSALPALAMYAANDQVAAQHAWVSVMAMDGAADGVGTLFVALSTLLAAWAIIAEKALSATLGWFGALTGIVGLLAFLITGNEALFAAGVVLPAIWLIWAGSTLRRAM